MSDLMQIAIPTPDQDWSVLFSMGSSGPQLAELKLNKAESVEHNNKKYPVSSPGIKIENAAFGEAYATDVRVASTQTSHNTLRSMIRPLWIGLEVTSAAGLNQRNVIS